MHSLTFYYSNVIKFSQIKRKSMCEKKKKIVGVRSFGAIGSGWRFVEDDGRATGTISVPDFM